MNGLPKEKNIPFKERNLVQGKLIKELTLENEQLHTDLDEANRANFIAKKSGGFLIGAFVSFGIMLFSLGFIAGIIFY